MSVLFPEVADIWLDIEFCNARSIADSVQEMGFEFGSFVKTPPKIANVSAM